MSNQLSNSIELLEVDLEESDALDGHKFDGIVSTYGVLSFLGSPDAAFRTFARVLKPGGYGLAMGHSLANALGSKIQSEAPFAELKRLVSDSVVKWSDTVPELRVFDTQSLEQLTTSAGLEALSCFGITTVVAPGTEDFGYPYTRVSDISRQLADPVRFNELLEFELDAAQRPGWADRGTNLMQWFRKPRM